MYTVSYDGKKQLGAKYLALLNINIEWLYIIDIQDFGAD